MQNRQSIYYLLTLLIPVFLVLGCGTSEVKGKKLAQYDGGQVTESEFTTSLDQLPERVRSVALQQKKEYLDSYIAEKLLLQEAEQKGFQHHKDVDALIRKARDKILVAKLVEQEVDLKSQVSAEEVRIYYDNQSDQYVTPYQLRASHILVRSRSEAEVLLTRIQGGESFEEIAKEFSMDPTGAKGGDIGFFEKGQLIPQIEEVAFALSMDEISDVVQSPFGYHIIKLTGEAKPQTKEFNLVAKDIEEKLIIEKKTRHFDDLISRLKRKANIRVNEEVLDSFTYEGSDEESNVSDAS